MRKILTAPNLAVCMACLAWIIACHAAIFAMGDLKPADPNSPADVLRFAEQIRKKDMIVTVELVLSAGLAFFPFIQACRDFKQAGIRYSISLLISSLYFGAVALAWLTTS